MLQAFPSFLQAKQEEKIFYFFQVLFKTEKTFDFKN